MKQFCIIILLFITFFTPLAADISELKTAAESSDYSRTMTNAEVQEFCQQLARQSPKVIYTSLGTTDGGRDIPLLIVGDPAPAHPGEMQNDHRTVIYIQANIHAGEVEGKEATLMLARDFALGKYKDVLKEAVILIAPNYNADGNSHIDPQNRYYQAGPEAVGRRQNDRNLDLNRDWIKLEASETRSVITNILNRWDPVLIIDCHTTNGSLHTEPMTWSPQTHPSGNRAILDYTRKVLIPHAAELTESEYGLTSIPYGNHIDRENREAGWRTFGYQGRYTTNYTGLRNRLSVLLESYVYAPYKDRVWSTYGFLRGLLEHVAANRETITGMINAADSQAYGRAEAINPEADLLALEVELSAFEGETVIMESWENSELYEDEQGRRRIRPAGEKIILEMPHYGNFTVLRSTVLPQYYAVDGYETEVIEKLRLHGIQLLELTHTASVSAERFYPTAIEHSERLNQGHSMTSLEGEWKAEEIELPAGTILVSSAQPLGMLAAYLLEPESDDGLTAWNYFDHRLTAQWGGRLLPHPVLRLHGSESGLALPLRQITR